jgi:hypothetical protein
MQRGLGAWSGWTLNFYAQCDRVYLLHIGYVFSFGFVLWCTKYFVISMAVVLIGRHTCIPPRKLPYLLPSISWGLSEFRLRLVELLFNKYLYSQHLKIIFCLGADNLTSKLWEYKHLKSIWYIVMKTHN